MPKVTTSLLAVVVVLLSGKVNSVSSVNVTRLQNNDRFTNPNHTAVSSCLASCLSSSFVDSCKTFQSTDTRAKCSSSSCCCGSCQCEKDYPIYLAHLGKCVNLVELNSDVFGLGSTGRSSLAQSSQIPNLITCIDVKVATIAGSLAQTQTSSHPHRLNCEQAIKCLKFILLLPGKIRQHCSQNESKSHKCLLLAL